MNGVSGELGDRSKDGANGLNVATTATKHSTFIFPFKRKPNPDPRLGRRNLAV
jgi:hypothetical protein